MAPMHPVGDPRVVKLQFQFDVSEDWIEEQLQETGMQMPERWEVEWDLPDVPVDLRADLVQAHRRYLELPGFPVFYAPIDDPRQFLAALSDWIQAASEESQSEEMQAVALRAAESELSEQFDGQREAWIADHGSERLKAAARRGYKVNHTYAVERAAMEYPRFWVDTSTESEIRERTDPSIKALKLEDAVRAWMSTRSLDADGTEPKIVWLVEPPKELAEFAESNGWYVDQQEAISVPEFLGRYLLILPVEEDLQRPVEHGQEVS